MPYYQETHTPISVRAYKAMSPSITVAILCVASVVLITSAFAYPTEPESPRPDVRIERRRTLMGYDDAGEPMYAEPEEFDTRALTTIGIVLGGAALVGSLGFLMLQLVGLGKLRGSDGHPAK